jgi:hypothetical protein
MRIICFNQTLYLRSKPFDAVREGYDHVTIITVELKTHGCQYIRLAYTLTTPYMLKNASHNCLSIHVFQCLVHHPLLLY